MTFSQDDNFNITTNDESLDETQTGWTDLYNSNSWKLPVDIYETKDNIIIKSCIAGTDAKDIEIILNNDIFTIKGLVTKDEALQNANCLYQECKWGEFSRSIILPCQVQTGNIETSFKKHILTVVLYKKLDSETINIKVSPDNTEE